MNMFKFPVLNWLILNGFAVYYLYLQEAWYWSFSGWMGVLGILVAIESIGWIAACLYYFARYKTSFSPIGKVSYLITTGPYRLSRNPLYLAFTSMSVSLSLMTHSIYFLVSGIVFWLLTDLYTIAQEEKFLSVRFKDEWTRYSQRTRRWL